MDFENLTEDQKGRAKPRSDENKYRIANQDQTAEKKDIDSQRHPEEQNVDPQVYIQKVEKKKKESCCD